MLSISRPLSDTSAQSDTLRYGRHSAKLPTRLGFFAREIDPATMRAEVQATS